MTEARHAYQTTSEGIHIPYNWSYADAAARTGASGFVAADVGKLALQQDDNSLWILTATTPTWVQAGGGSGSGAFLRADGTVTGATTQAQVLTTGLGVGATPTGKLDVYGAGANPTVYLYDDTGPVRFSAEVFSDLAGDEPQFNFRHARGTIAAPTATQLNDELGTMFFAGMRSDGVWQPAASIRAYADGEFSTAGDLSDAPGRIVFETVPDGSATRAERLSIMSTGDIKIHGGAIIPSADSTTALRLGNAAGTAVMTVDTTNSRTGFGATPTAAVHIKAGTAAASTAPLKLTSGVNLTTPEAGAMEYDGRFSLTETAGTRRFIVQAVASTKTTAAAPYTNDGYVTVTINGTDVKLMTTA